MTFNIHKNLFSDFEVQKILFSQKSLEKIFSFY